MIEGSPRMFPMTTRTSKAPEKFIDSCKFRFDRLFGRLIDVVRKINRWLFVKSSLRITDDDSSVIIYNNIRVINEKRWTWTLRMHNAYKCWADIFLSPTMAQ